MQNHSLFDADDSDQVPESTLDDSPADPGQESYNDPRIGEGKTEGEESAI